MAFDLSSIQKTKQSLPPRVVIYSDDGMGKSTFGAQAPSPIFIQTEQGLDNISAESFPLATCYQDVIDAIGTLYGSDHNYQTVVVDSLDWMQALVWKHVAKEAGHENIEDFGYGKGYTFAADLFREVLGGLNALRNEKGMGVILTAHSMVKRFDDPRSEPYDRYILKLHQSSAALVREWADVVGFIGLEMAVKAEDVGFNKKVARGIVTGGHMLHVRRTPAYDAKCRYDIPDAIPLSWSAFADALAQSHNKPQTKEEEF